MPAMTRPITASRITAPLRIRTVSGLSRGKALRFRGGAAAEAADPALVVGDRMPQILNAEVGPQRFADVDLRVCRLPEQEVAHAVLAGGADDQVGFRQLRMVEAARHLALVHPLGRHALG